MCGRVLVAEDCRDTRSLLRIVLEKAGLKVEFAENGHAACQMAAQSDAEGRPYDVILMDVQMPELDGYEAARRLRRSGWRRPIIALTAHGMAGQGQCCLAAGYDGCAAKPIQEQELLSAIAAGSPGPPLLSCSLCRRIRTGCSTASGSAMPSGSARCELLRQPGRARAHDRAGPGGAPICRS